MHGGYHISSKSLAHCGQRNFDTTTRARPVAIAADRAGVFASGEGDLELVAAEGRSVFITGGLECAETAALNSTATRLRLMVSALEARVSTLEARDGP